MKKESIFLLQEIINKRISLVNKTLQASPAVRCRDAQTGGLLFSILSFFTSAPVFANNLSNIPAMPLIDAHFGGFFAFGGCQ